uniref:Uncharacterized protein n=1 Tax=Candidozyma auris TaxID=498019 RepID=A0A0L0P4V4_CANAR
MNVNIEESTEVLRLNAKGGYSRYFYFEKLRRLELNMDMATNLCDHVHGTFDFCDPMH